MCAKLNIGISKGRDFLFFSTLHELVDKLLWGLPFPFASPPYENAFCCIRPAEYCPKNAKRMPNLRGQSEDWLEINGADCHEEGYENPHRPKIKFACLNIFGIADETDFQSICADHNCFTLLYPKYHFGVSIVLADHSCSVKSIKNPSACWLIKPQFLQITGNIGTPLLPSSKLAKSSCKCCMKNPSATAKCFEWHIGHSNSFTRFFNSVTARCMLALISLSDMH